MERNIVLTTLVVRDYDEAIAYYRDSLNFELLEDTRLSDTKRWVRMRPVGSDGAGVLLAQASTDSQVEAVGNQTGGRVFLFLHTDDFMRDYKLMKEKGVAFHSEPRIEEYGTVAVFEDLYGNKWDMIQPR